MNHTGSNETHTNESQDDVIHTGSSDTHHHHHHHHHNTNNSYTTFDEVLHSIDTFNYRYEKVQDIFNDSQEQHHRLNKSRHYKKRKSSPVRRDSYYKKRKSSPYKKR